MQTTPPLFIKNRIARAFNAFSLSPGIEPAGEQAVIPGDMGINTRSSAEATSLNRSVLLTKLGRNPANLALVKQVHGSHIVYAERPGILGEADGLVTDRPEIDLGILVADCAAVLMADTKNGVIGAFHAGWHGAVANILPAGLSAMRELGAREIAAWISPCISPLAFEVGEEVADSFPSAFVLRQGKDKPHVDLPGFLMNQMVEGGIRARSIRVDGRCTMTDRRFFSYRRQGRDSGRMLAVIGLKA